MPSIPKDCPERDDHTIAELHGARVEFVMTSAVAVELGRRLTNCPLRVAIRRGLS